MTVHVARHCERRAWDKSPAKKSDDDTGRRPGHRHCEHSEAIQIESLVSGLLRVLRQALQPPRNDGVTSFVIISEAKQSRKPDNVQINDFAPSIGKIPCKKE